jgi:hypothetical protein
LFSDLENKEKHLKEIIGNNKNYEIRITQIEGNLNQLNEQLVNKDNIIKVSDNKS